MKIKYVGSKQMMPIMEPIGIKPTKRSKLFCTVCPGDEIELEDKQAIALAKLDSINFKLVKSGALKEKEPEEELKVSEDKEEVKPKAKRRGRPRKIKAEDH